MTETLSWALSDCEIAIGVLLCSALYGSLVGRFIATADTSETLVLAELQRWPWPGGDRPAMDDMARVEGGGLGSNRSRPTTHSCVASANRSHWHVGNFTAEDIRRAGRVEQWPGKAVRGSDRV